MSAPFTSEQDRFFEVARVEMAKADAALQAATDASDYWDRSQPTGDLQTALSLQAGAAKAGAMAAYRYWRGRVPIVRGEEIIIIDENGRLVCLPAPKSLEDAPSPSRQSGS